MSAVRRIPLEEARAVLNRIASGQPAPDDANLLRALADRIDGLQDRCERCGEPARWHVHGECPAQLEERRV